LRRNDGHLPAGERKDWTKVFPDALNAQVIAERLTEPPDPGAIEF
jgi:hypothetical protein